MAGREGLLLVPNLEINRLASRRLLKPIGMLVLGQPPHWKLHRITAEGVPELPRGHEFDDGGLPFSLVCYGLDQRIADLVRVLAGDAFRPHGTGYFRVGRVFELPTDTHTVVVLTHTHTHTHVEAALVD